MYEKSECFLYFEKLQNNRITFVKKNRNVSKFSGCDKSKILQYSTNFHWISFLYNSSTILHAFFFVEFNNSTLAGCLNNRLRIELSYFIAHTRLDLHIWFTAIGVFARYICLLFFLSFDRWLQNNWIICITNTSLKQTNKYANKTSQIRINLNDTPTDRSIYYYYYYYSYS